MELLVNDELRAIDPIWQGESLLFVLREHLQLVGAKLGCGAGLCGACTVLVDGQPVRSCVTPASSIHGQRVTTIEGLAKASGQLHPVQQAWMDAAVSQCGYCQSGQIMATVALLRRHAKPNEQQIDEALAGHLCRCGTQQRVKTAIQVVTKQVSL
jgi:isoquinoline 1-oxidoreductase subunit alpha